MSTSYVYYSVQGDRDDPEHPNAFVISKPYDRILVGDVRECFPLSGNFHFRFKIKYEAYGHVWLDLTDDARKVPICDGKVTLKCLPVDSVPPSETRTIPNTRTAAAASSSEASVESDHVQGEHFPAPSSHFPSASASQETRTHVDSSDPFGDLGTTRSAPRAPASNPDDFFFGGPQGDGGLEDLFS